MANILFKRGNHSALMALKAQSKIVDGTFYLTEDSHRLYAGIGSDLVDLNKYIQIVTYVEGPTDSLQTLTNVQDGDFAYVSASNILAVYHNGWQQINVDTKTVSFTASNKGSDTLTLTIKDNKGDEVPCNVKITGAKGINVTVNASGEVEVEDNPYTLVKTYDGESDGSTEVTAMTVTLTPENTETGVVEPTNFKLSAGSNIYFNKTADGIEISGEDAAAFNKATDKSYLDVNKGTPTLKLTLANGNDITLSDANSLYYTYGKATATATTGTKTAYNQEWLDVYTTAEVDAKLAELNAMTYKGALLSASLPSDSVRIGDTYMIGESGISLSVGTGNIVNGPSSVATDTKIGDLVIATSTDGTETNGVIPANKIQWTYIPAGDDSQTDTTYTFTANNNIFSIGNNTTNETDAAIEIVGDSKVTVTGKFDQTKAGSVGTPWKVTVEHAGVNFTPGTDSESNVDTVDSIIDLDVDTTGHVNGYKVKTTKVNTYALASKAKVATNGTNTIKVTDTLNKSDSTSTTSTFNVAVSGEDNLNIAPNTAGDGFELSMVWGSF